MADPTVGPLGPEFEFKALLKRLIDTPKAALDKLEVERKKRPKAQETRVRYRPKYGPLEQPSGRDPGAYLGGWYQWVYLMVFPAVMLAVAGPDAALLAFAILMAFVALGALLENR